MVWIGRELKGWLILIPMTWAGILFTISGCPNMHPTWSWLFPGLGKNAPLFAARCLVETAAALAPSRSSPLAASNDNNDSSGNSSSNSNSKNKNNLCAFCRGYPSSGELEQSLSVFPSVILLYSAFIIGLNALFYLSLSSESCTSANMKVKSEERSIIAIIIPGTWCNCAAGCRPCGSCGSKQYFPSAVPTALFSYGLGRLEKSISNMAC